MYDKSQLLKGILEGCILSVLTAGENYGYAILEELCNAGFKDIKEGSVYPVLTRLEKRGYISVKLVPSNKGPSRKCYSMTTEGKQYYQEFVDSWNELAVLIEKLVK